jgi:hypothetical protein
MLQQPIFSCDNRGEKRRLAGVEFPRARQDLIDRFPAVLENDAVIPVKVFGPCGPLGVAPADNVRSFVDQRPDGGPARPIVRAQQRRRIRPLRRPGLVGPRVVALGLGSTGQVHSFDCRDLPRHHPGRRRYQQCIESGSRVFGRVCHSSGNYQARRRCAAGCWGPRRRNKRLPAEATTPFYSIFLWRSGPACPPRCCSYPRHGPGKQ